jgi:histidinol-phosphatase
MFDLLRRDRPQDSVLGEETGLRGRGSRRWIIDPIDGTFNFVEGDPVWGTHVALEDSGELVLGMITRPVRGQRWWASQGGGAHRTSPDPSGDTVQLHTSTVDELSRSRASLWALPDAHIDRRWRDLAHWTISVEPTLDDILELAEGNREIVVDTLGEVWDQAPAVILVEEAGGRFRDRDGGRRLDRRPGLYTNGHVAPALDAYLYDGPSSSR